MSFSVSFRQTKIQHLHHAVAVPNHHVFRFHVAMNDVRLVRSIERGQHLDADVEYFAEA